MDSGITRTLRSHPPSHYLFKIESFSVLAEATVEKFKSDAFEAGGHRWRLVLYPNGNKKSNGNGYISLYLEIEKTENFSLNWEVNVDFKLFVFDQIRDLYLAIKGAREAILRDEEGMGFSQLLFQETFNDGGNGYLVEDCCIFGAEVLLLEPSPKLGKLCMIKNPSGGTITWKIENFSLLRQKSYNSPVQSVGDIEWYLQVYPKGSSEAEGTHLSLFLNLAEPDKLPPKREIYVKYKLRLRDQINSNHFEKFKASAENWFGSATSWGYSKFVSLKDLKESSKGYLVEDALVVEAEIFVMSKFEAFTDQPQV